MAEISKFNKLVEEFRNEADFLVIYIEEAHASDGWKFPGNRYQFAKHKDQAARLEAASRLVEKGVACDVVVDTMADEANKAYGGLYERLYVIQDGVVVYEGGRGPGDYHLDEVVDWLHKHFRS